LVSKFGNQSIREILALTSGYASPPLQTLEEGEESPNAIQQGEENAILSWREIARVFWATTVFLGGKLHVTGNRMTTIAFEEEVSLKS